MNVPFFNLSPEFHLLEKEIQKSIKKVLTSGRFILGDEGSAFEKEFADFLGANYAIGVASGTDGLVLALHALGVGKGDEVITQANTFIATVVAITLVGARPVLVDVDPLTHQMDVEKLEKAITKKTKAIIPVHLYGSPSPIDKIKQLAKKHSLFLIEDACQAHGAKVNGKTLGTFGDIAVFSFYPSKNLGAYGDGGAIVTNSASLDKKIRLLRNYGQTKKYHHDTFGINSRLDEIQAAVLRVKLKNLVRNIKNRQQTAKLYTTRLKNVTIPPLYENSESVYHLFVIEHAKRDSLQKYLANENIDTMIHYPVPVHLQRVYTYLGYRKGSFPISENLAKSILSLPIFFGITKEEIEYVAEKINSF